MTYNVIVNENQLDQWVRENSSIAQGVIVELVWRLVAASSPNPKERRFPLGDSLGQHGPDGILDAVIGFDRLCRKENRYGRLAPTTTLAERRPMIIVTSLRQFRQR